MDLNTSIERLFGVGPQYQKKLKKLGIHTIKDLFFHFPHRYEDFSNIIPIAKAKIGETVCLQGEILEIKNNRTWKKRMILTQAVVKDKSGTIKVVWFNQPYLTNVLKKENYVCLAGKVVLGKQGSYLSNPIYEKINSKFKIQNSKFDLTHTGRLVPVYPETEGLSSRWLRFIIKPLLEKLKNKIIDPLPQKIIAKYQFMPLNQSLWQIHFPDSIFLAQLAKKRFSFEEIFYISLFTQRERKKLLKEKAVSLPINFSLVQDFIKSLPFELTDSQERALWQILKDLEQPWPMNRLLEGDVGSGKTVVATIVSLNTIKSGFQVAFMAPTEILAKQHFKTIKNFLE